MPTSATNSVLRAVILGAPASGKGTISSRIIKYFDIAHVSSGDSLRQEIARESLIGKEAKKYITGGILVPDDVILKLITSKLKSLGNVNWLLDGFPRTRYQAECLQKEYCINAAILLNVPQDVILSRFKDRWVHIRSGRVYNSDFNRPKVWGKDDITGEALVQRTDDKPEAIRKRLSIYKNTMQPIIDFYSEIEVLKICTGNSSDEIWPQVSNHLNGLLKCKKVPLSNQ